MTFEQSIKLVYWKKYANFSSRASRSEYWYSILFLSFIHICIIQQAHLFAPHPELPAYLSYDIPEATSFFYILNGILNIYTTIPGIAVLIRRCHDLGHSAWLLLWNLLPIIGTIGLIIYLMFPSQACENKYGAIANNNQ